MKLILAMTAALFTVSSAYAQDSLKTVHIEQWGYTQDHLVLFLQNGEQVKVAPKFCSLEKFNETMTARQGIDLHISSKHIRANVPFVLVSQNTEGASRLKCMVKRLST